MFQKNFRAIFASQYLLGCNSLPDNSLIIYNICWAGTFANLRYVVANINYYSPYQLKNSMKMYKFEHQLLFRYCIHQKYVFILHFIYLVFLAIDEKYVLSFNMSLRIQFLPNSLKVVSCYKLNTVTHHFQCYDPPANHGALHLQNVRKIYSYWPNTQKNFQML